MPIRVRIHSFCVLNRNHLRIGPNLSDNADAKNSYNFFRV